jgi:hypothetical protein
MFEISNNENYFLAGCQKCDEKAVYSKELSKLIYPITKGNPRTDENYASRTPPLRHNTGFKEPMSHVLEEIGTFMVTQFPTDPMHAVDLGVCKAMLRQIFTKNCLRYKRDFLENISCEYESLKHWIPSEFPRKARSLDQLAYWKATEGRLFILYTGFIFFDRLQNDDIFYNFCLLSCAIRLLSGESISQDQVHIADQMLQSYVENVAKIFGQNDVTYNMHALLHLPECVAKFVPLYSFSCYAFENYMQEIKGYVRNAHNILQQLFNRHEEEEIAGHNNENIPKVVPGFNKIHKVPQNGFQTTSSEYNTSKFMLNNTQRDQNCLLTDGSTLPLNILDAMVYSTGRGV